MQTSIRKQTLERNSFVALTGAVCAIALVGALVYLTIGWPQSTMLNIALLVLPCVGVLLLMRENDTRIYCTPVPRQHTFLLLNSALTILIIISVLYVGRHSATDWIGSPWQALDARKFLPFIFAVIALTAWGVMRQKISARILFFAFLLLLALELLVFPRGAGYDVFVHDATVRAWIERGNITPLQPLYAGFYSIVASISTVIGARPLVVLSWLVPLVASALLTTLLVATRHTREHFHRAPYILLGFFIVFTPLFTTATPQALGHMLLFGLIADLWLAHDHLQWRRWVLRLIIALGITVIHPLSGVIALTLLAWMFVVWSSWRRAVRTPLLAAIAVLAVLGAPLLLLIGTRGTIDVSLLTAESPLALIFSEHESFQPFVLTTLAYALSNIGRIFLLVSALFGYAVRLSCERPERRLFQLALLIVISGFLSQAVMVPNVITYEQSAFASRIITAGFLLMIPLAAAGFAHLWARVRSRIDRLVIAAVAIAAVCASWYVAFPAWNSVARTKAVNTAPRDFEIVKKIDAHADKAPYIVLADQATSAAALYAFGFYDRRVPDREFYFYPVPTGDILYTNYFLPAMYDGVTRALLERAARHAHVAHVYVVVKPYWNVNAARRDQLRRETDDQFMIENTLVGHFKLK